MRGKNLATSGGIKRALALLYEARKMFAPDPWQVELGASIVPDTHGFDGDLHLGFSITEQNNSFYQSVQQSWANLGQTMNDDVNSGTTGDSAACPQTIDPELKQRWDSATAFLWLFASRLNFHLINGTVLRVMWKQDEGMRDSGHAEASGVEYITPDKQRQPVLASKEVIP